MQRDPRSLGLDGFTRAGSAAARYHLARLGPTDPCGLILEKSLRLPPDAGSLQLEGPGSADLDVCWAGAALGCVAPGVFTLLPGFDESGLLRLAFPGAAAPITGIWILP